MSRYVLHVPTGGAAVHAIPDPSSEKPLEWMLRYAPESLDDKRSSPRLAAAGVIAGFECLLCDTISGKEAIRRLRILRRAWRDAASGSPATPDKEHTDD